MTRDGLPTVTGATAAKLVEESRAIAKGGFETATIQTLQEVLVPRVLRLVDAAVDFANALLSDDPSEATPASAVRELSVQGIELDGLVESAQSRSDDSWRDLVFICGMDLRSRRAGLEQAAASTQGLDARGAPLLLVACDSTARKVRKGICAIDQALAVLEGRSPAVDFSTELASSLKTRRLYAGFRRSFAEDDRKGPRSMVAQVRSVGIRIAVLGGADEYPDLRLADRMALRSLQARILVWLRDPASADAGRRLLEDARAFVDMLAGVNLRQELVEHDAKFVACVEKRLGHMPSVGQVPEELWVLAAPLTGLSDGLDQLLERRHGTVSELQAAVAEAAGGPHSSVRSCASF